MSPDHASRATYVTEMGRASVDTCTAQRLILLLRRGPVERVGIRDRAGWCLFDRAGAVRTHGLEA